LIIWMNLNRQSFCGIQKLDKQGKLGIARRRPQEFLAIRVDQLRERHPVQRAGSDCCLIYAVIADFPAFGVVGFRPN
jgi:hypothetical protein